MAQETRVNPIQLNDNAQKIIMDLGDTFEKQGLQNQQMRMKQAEMAYERRKQYENQYNDLQKWYYDKATSLKASPDEINKALEVGKEQLAQMHLKGSDINDMMNTAQGYLGKLNMAAGVRNVVESQVEGAAKQNPEIDQETLRAFLEKNVLFGRDPKEVDVNTNHAKQALYDPRNWNLWDYKKSLEKYTEQIEKGPQTEEAEKTVDSKGVWRSNESKRVKFNPQFFEQDGKGGFKLKTDADGLFSAKDYKSFISNPANNAVLENKVQTFIDHYNEAPSNLKQRMIKEYVGPEQWDEITGKKNLPANIDPNDTETRDLLKRVYLTHDLSASPTLKTQSQGNIQTKITVNTGNGNNVPVNVLPDIDSDIKQLEVTKGKNYIGAPLSEIGSGNAITALKNLYNNAYKNKDTEYTAADLTVSKDKNGAYTISDITGQKLKVKGSEINQQVNKDLGNKVEMAGLNNDRPKDVSPDRSNFKTSPVKMTFNDWKAKNPNGTFADYTKAIK